MAGIYSNSSEEAPADLDQQAAGGSASEALDDSTLESILATHYGQAEDWVDSELSITRAKAARYYRGEPFGTEEEGRSQVVSRDVRDVIGALMPELMRVFFGAERVVEYAPRKAEDVEYAEQATDYIGDVVIRQDNDGFRIIYDGVKDALLKAAGIFKWWYEEVTEVSGDEYTGLGEDELLQLMEEQQEIPGAEVDFDVEQKVEEGEESEDDESAMPGAGAPAGPPSATTPAAPGTPEDAAQQAPTYSAKVTRKNKKCRIRFAAVPPEEFLITPKATSVESALYSAHRTKLTVGQLCAMGYSKDRILELRGSSTASLDVNEERLDREMSKGAVTMPTTEETADESGLECDYVEHFIRVDVDGDGIPELREICTVGGKILRNRIITERPFAVGSPDPEPHMVMGESIADMVDDVQLIKSTVLRNVLDSLGESITPRTTVVEGQVNLSDVLNNRRGAIIRQSAPGMVQEFSKDFAGAKAFPVLAYLDELKESRVGMSKASAGLDPDSLQSTTKAAVAATVSASRARIELIARILAETLIRPLMRGLLKLSVRHQDQARTVKLRGKWTAVNPADWDAEMDLIVKVGIGSGTVEDRVMALEKIAARQEAILQQYGPDNPLVTVAQYRATLAKIIQIGGFPDASQFFSVVPADWKPPAPAQPPPDPSMVLAQVQADQIRADMQVSREKMALEREKAIWQDDRERDRLDADVYLRAAEIQGKYGTQVDIATIRAAVDHARNMATVQSQQAAQQQQLQQ